MSLSLIQLSVGPWPMNGFVLICEETRSSAIVDPGADPSNFLQAAKDTRVGKILITHAHPDHVGALDEIRKATGARVFMHPDEREMFGTRFDVSLHGGDMLRIGNYTIRTYHTPGHTPGGICFDIGEYRVLVGDVIFVNGPGHTDSAKDFATSMHTLTSTVFRWPDETRFYPGHGESATIGKERVRFEAFCARGWEKTLHGDVEWE